MCWSQGLVQRGADGSRAAEDPLSRKNRKIPQGGLCTLFCGPYNWDPII